MFPYCFIDKGTELLGKTSGMDCAVELIRGQILAVKGHLVQEGKDGTLVVPVVVLEFGRKLFDLVQEAEEVLLHDNLAQPFSQAKARFLKSYIIKGAQLGDKDCILPVGCHLLLYFKPYFGGIILFGDYIHYT